MKETRFKVGDKVRFADNLYTRNQGVAGKIGRYLEDDGTGKMQHRVASPDSSDYHHYADEDIVGLASATGGAAKAKEVKFLLKYELDEDPIEEFETMKQVQKRIRELMKDDTLKRDSVVVYEIKSKKTVEFGTTFKLKTA